MGRGVTSLLNHRKTRNKALVSKAIVSNDAFSYLNNKKIGKSFDLLVLLG